MSHTAKACRDIFLPGDQLAVRPLAAFFPLRLFCVLSLTTILVVSGCGGGQDKHSKKVGSGSVTLELDSRRLDSAHWLLDEKEFEKFQIGKLQETILKEINWRGNFEQSAQIDGKEITAISYKLCYGGGESDRGEVVWAIFVDARFDKFVQWPKGDMEVVDFKGTPWSRAKPVKVGDFSLLARAAHGEAIDLRELSKLHASRSAPKSQIDPGLTIAWLLLQYAGKGIQPTTKQDFRDNADLRNQFNASRLRLGMDESEVAGIFRADPLESCEVDGQTVNIYGSMRQFNIKDSLLFANIMVVFAKGKAIVIYSMPGGTRGRNEMQERFSDLPEPKSYSRRGDKGTR